MTRQPIIALLATLVIGACSTEPAREQAAGSPAPTPAAEAQPGEAPVVSEAPLPADGPGAGSPVSGPDSPVSDAGSAPAQPGPAAPGTGPRPVGATTPATPAPAAPATGGGMTGSTGAATQTDAGADVLRRASAAYENVRSMRATFTMNFENPLLRQATTSKGTLYQQQPDRIALRFSEPDGDVILSDGRFFWVYYPSVNAQQVIRSPAAAGGESGVNLQAQFVGNPVERFRYELHGTEQVAGRTAHALTLVPRQRAEYRSLRVWIDARDGLARRFEITEHNGNIRRFDLHDLQVNPNIPQSVFQFTPPPGARVVDAG
jgi:outer membrane lipoprotein carrier protein